MGVRGIAMISAIASSPVFSFDRFFLSGREGKEGSIPPFAGKTEAAGGQDASAEKGNPSRKSTKPGELSDEQQREVAKLAATDRKVRAHEQAHVSVGGELVQGGANFQYQTGPDGRRYAVGGEVNIDTSEGSTPEETIPKAQKIRAAALAPADPSPQDHRVAGMAMRMEMQARMEVAMQKAEEGGDTTGPTATPVAKGGEKAVAAYRSVASSGQSAGFRAFA